MFTIIPRKVLFCKCVETGGLTRVCPEPFFVAKSLLRSSEVRSDDEVVYGVYAEDLPVGRQVCLLIGRGATKPQPNERDCSRKGGFRTRSGSLIEN